ncbi:MAG: DNA polymerase III subunit beta [Bdellovibrionales bacterium]|nr:DNA polymerase III subunit beta [Bdellovibrionales bacterium]
MKIDCQQKDLFRALQTVVPVTEKKTTMPILGNLLFQVQDNQLLISGTDLELSIQSECPVKSHLEGQICTPAQQWMDIVRRLPSPDVSIQKDDHGWLILKSGKAQFRIAGIDAEEFPKLPDLKDHHFQNVRKNIFLEGIERTAYAMSVDEIRYNLNGIFMEKLVEDELSVIKMVSTDGHRLAFSTSQLQNGEDLNLEKGVILPRKGVMELKRLLPEYSDETIQVSISQNNAAFVAGGTKLFMKMVVGDFPKYQDVIPKGERKKLVVQKSLLTDSLKRVSILSEGKSKAVKFSIRPDGILLSAQSPELGEAQEDIPAEFTGGELQIGFNAKYVLDALHVFQEEKIVFELDHEQSPGILKELDENKSMSVIMPMRI